MWLYFYEFFVKSKPYDFCSLKSKVLRDNKIKNIFEEFSSYRVYKAEKEDGPFIFAFVKEEQMCLDLAFIFGISSKAGNLKLASTGRLLLKKILQDSDKAYFKGEIRRTFKVRSFKKWIEKCFKNVIIFNDEKNTVIFCNKNIMKIKFKVVGTNKATEHLVGKDAFLKSTRKVKHGLLREITIDEKIYLLDEKSVDFLVDRVLIHGHLSDDKENVGKIALEFQPHK